MTDVDSDPSTLADPRVVEVSFSGPNWLVRSLVAAASVVLVVLAIVLLSGVLAVGVVVMIIVGVVLWVRSWFRRQRGPNGMLDGRRNVRVVSPRPRSDQ